MDIYELKINLDKYLTPFEKSDDAEKYFPNFSCPISHSRAHGQGVYFTSEHFVNLSYECQTKAQDKLKMFFKTATTGICISLGIKVNFNYPEFDPNLKEGIVEKGDKLLKGSAIGAVVSTVLTGSPIFGAAIGGVIGHNDHDSKADQIFKLFYNNSIMMREKCKEYLKSEIDNLSKVGKTCLKMEPEWGIYNAKCICPECGRKLKPIKGPYGWFMGCSGYPSCKHKEKYICMPKLKTKQEDKAKVVSGNTHDTIDIVDDDLPF